MKQSLIYSSILVYSLLLFSSCNWLKKDQKIIDVSSVHVETDINRFDKAFFTADTLHLYESLQAIREKDTVFFDFYTNQIMRFGIISDSITPTMLDINHFFTNEYVLGLYDTVQAYYPNLENLTTELNTALKHYKYYFPNSVLPQFKTIVSEFGYNVVALDTAYIAIALDMYLGKDYKYYGSFDFPYYLINRFEAEYIVPNVMDVLYNAYFDKTILEETEPLIYNMIENGKKLYFLECMQPKKEKHIIMGYSKEELKWVEESESEIWKFYNEHDLFYTKNYMEQKRHIGDAPTTVGMPQEAPGNVGSWVGWQIVEKYMKNRIENQKDKTIDLAELIHTPADVILKKSKYKPK